MNKIPAKAVRDIDILSRFVKIYCEDRHNGAARSALKSCGIVGEILRPHNLKLCPSCTRLILHGTAKRLMCPYDPKPRCKKCPTPCYAPFYRRQIKDVMRSSGWAMIKRGRLDLLWKYFL